MRKLAIGLALTSTALASPSMARDGQWYVGVDGGAMIVEDSQFDVGTTPNAVVVDHTHGYDFDGVVGYDFGGFRLESEVGYREADPSNLRSTVRIPTQSLTITNNGTFPYVAGDVNVLSFMLNGMLDFGDDDGLQGFVGAGGGVARVNHHYSVNRLGPGWINDSDTGFAWQALAGIRAPISDSWDAGIKYRYFNANGVDLVDTVGRAVSTKFRSHSLMGSLVYNFGGAPAEKVEEVMTPPPPPPPAVVVVPPPPPPVVVVPPPPPPPRRPVCDTSPKIVFFDWDKANLRPDAIATLDQAVAQYATCNSKVMIAGHADKSGKPAYNLALSKRRNTSVQNYLVSKGIPAGAITSNALGESQSAVETADGVREQQNRRVEVTYGPGSGN